MVWDGSGRMLFFVSLIPGMVSMFNTEQLLDARHCANSFYTHVTISLSQ